MDKKLETYQDLSTQYYDLDKPVLLADEWEFFLDYAKRAQGRILEPMCGTGRFLIPLLEEGYDVDGFDASPYMLQKCQQKVQAADLSANLWLGFLEDLDTKETYNLVFIPAGSLNLIIDRDAVLRSLQAIYACLKSGGIFVFELISLEFVSALPSGTTRNGSVTCFDGRRITIMSVDLPLVDQVGVSVCRYQLLDGNEVLLTETENFSLRFYSEMEMRQLLIGVGFKDIKIIKAFKQGVVPDPDDMVVIYECRK